MKLRGLQHNPYPERREYINVESLENRRTTAHLVLNYTICNNLIDVEANDFFEFRITALENIDLKSENRRNTPSRAER